MAIKVNENWKEKLIQNIKDCGKALIDDAENMIGDYEYPNNLIITCYVDERDGAPYISVDRHFIPENWVKRYI